MLFILAFSEILQDNGTLTYVSTLHLLALIAFKMITIGNVEVGCHKLV